MIDSLHALRGGVNSTPVAWIRKQMESEKLELHLVSLRKLHSQDLKYLSQTGMKEAA